MNLPWNQRIRRAVLAAGCVGALTVCSSAPAGLPLAQANPAPPPGAATVSPPPKYYIVEGIVVVLLVAGAVFAVCRTSGRT